MTKTISEQPEVIRLRETVSTNDYIKALLAERLLAEGSIVVAEYQTGGRGQLGNVWESEAGKNLLFSVVLYPDCIQANQQFIISQMAALSICRTLSEYTDDVRVKWPNDIYWKDKKICGMLIENDIISNAISKSIIGIGLNINQEVFTGDAPNPVSLKQITGQAYNLDDMLHNFRRHFYSMYLQLLQDKADDMRNEYRTMLYRGEGVFKYKDAAGEFNAIIADIEPMGHLVLQLTDDTFRRYAFKEVSFI
jgi:birA, biotin-[acetyl-CoA-carboxylase] ligase region